MALAGMIMRRSIIVLSALALLLAAGPVPALAECVFLRDGSIMRGQIAAETGSSITVKPADGPAKTVSRALVLRILYTDIYLGRVVVRLTDGTSLEAFMVDENADAYIFRDDLYRAVEYTIPRKKVLFMARTNPTDLRGSAGTTSIRIAWFPPYKPPKEYRVYFREKGKARYERAGATRWLTYAIRGLGRKTRYRVIVTAVDGTGGESLPTDELDIMTNTPPDPPPGTRLARLPVEKGKMPVKITWRPAADPDGMVKNYRVYRCDGEKYALAGETAGNDLTVQGLDPGVTSTFAVRSVDNDGVESEDARVNTRVIEFDIHARGCFLMPVRNLGTILNPGWGGLITISAANFPAWGLNIGLGSGYLNFNARGGTMGASRLVPLFFTAGYRIMITGAFSIAPELFGGCSYISIEYRGNRLGFHGVIYPSRKGYEPFAMAGLVLSYAIRGRYFFLISADYGAVFERGSVLDFIIAAAGFGVRM
jgi:hypothetical protein